METDLRQGQPDGDRGQPVPEPAAPPSAFRRFLFALAVLLLLSLVCAPLYLNTLSTAGPAVRSGVATFDGQTDWRRAFALTGRWRLTWRAPDLASGPHAGEVAEVAVPGVWQGARTARGAALPAAGLARYDLTLRGLPPGGYTLFVPTISHASQVWIDGRLASTRGVVGATATATRYFWRPHQVSFDADGRDIHVAIDIAAFRHVSNGLEAAPVVGVAAVMEARSATLFAQQLLFIVTLLLLFFYGAVVFSFRSDDLPSLYFALSCLCLIPTAMVIGHDNLLALLYGRLSFPTMMSIEYLSCIATFMLLLAYVDALFPRERSRLLVWGFQAVFAVSIAGLAVVLAAGDTRLASALDRYPLFVAAVELLYIIAVVCLATVRHRDGAAVFLLGVTVFAVTAFQAILVEYDIVPENQVIGYAFAPMGLVVFSFAQIIILAERWSLAIRATEALALDLRRLMEVSASITSEVRLDVLLRKVVEGASRFLQADRGALFLHDPRTDQLWSMVAEGMETREIRLPASSGLAGDSFRTGEATIVNDAYADPRFNRAVDEATGYHTRSVLTLPIVTRDGRRLGVMQALNRRDGAPFEAADLTRLRAFAANAAVALDNAALFSDILAARNYNDSILASMSGGVITLNAEGVVETLNAAAAEILEVEAGAVRGLTAAAALSGANQWLVDAFVAVRDDGQARALLDVDIVTAGGRTISVNLSIVPLIRDETAAGLVLLFEDISQEKRLKGAMRRFMTQSVVDQILERQDDLPFGSACVASVLFADIRGFTSLAEHLKPRETVDMLNEVFGELVEAVSANDGVVDKFIGDAIMAVFGAPISSCRDALNAVDSASAMMGLVAMLNARRRARGEPPLRLGVGVATGDLIAGAIGSPKRMEYTVIGDSVNLASRLQDLTKTYGVGVILCDATARAAGDGHVLRRLDTVAVRGRARPERIHELLTYLDEEAFPHRGEVLAAYAVGLERLEALDWAGAATAFASALALNPEDGPSRLMFQRAKTAEAGAVVV